MPGTHPLRNEFYPYLLRRRVLPVSSGEREEKGLAIGGYESAFLADLVASYLFENAKANFRPTIYQVIYRDDGLVVFKGKKKANKIRDWIE